MTIDDYARERGIEAVIEAYKDINKTDAEIFSYLKMKFGATEEEFQRIKERVDKAAEND